MNGPTRIKYRCFLCGRVGPAEESHAMYMMEGDLVVQRICTCERCDTRVRVQELVAYSDLAGNYRLVPVVGGNGVAGLS